VVLPVSLWDTSFQIDSAAPNGQMLFPFMIITGDLITLVIVTACA